MPYNSTHFNLNNWNITLPVDSKGSTRGTAAEVENLTNYENPNYFWDARDGAMVFRAMSNGATTSGTKYARSELREMKGEERAAWKLSEGGTMSATLKIDAIPKWSDGSAGRMVVGQIHGNDHELVRLYYEDGTVHFVNDRAGPGNKETSFTLHNARGEQPKIGLGEKFSYLIDAQGKTLTVKVFADGQEYKSVTHINSVWQSDHLYFKAGVYLGINESNGRGEGQASFYGLDFSHTNGGGHGGWKTKMSGGANADNHDRRTITPESPENGVHEINGNARSNVLNGTHGKDVIIGHEGNDILRGGGGNDTLFGNEGNDRLIGGAGSNTMKGGNGADTFVVMKQGQIVNVVDFSVANRDRIDVTDVLGTVFGFKKALAFDEGFLQVHQRGNDVGIYTDADGNAGHAQRELVAVLQDATASEIGHNSFILPEHGRSTHAKASADINGNASSNMLSGTGHNDVIRGQGGNDIVNGGTGRDTLWGHAGNDTISGGSGADVIRGGAGRDTYVFKDIKDAGDIIQDFRDGEKLDISDLVDNYTNMQHLTASQLEHRGFISIVEESAKHVDVYMDVDGAAGPAHDVLLTSVFTLSSHDVESDIILL